MGSHETLSKRVKLGQGLRFASNIFSWVSITADKLVNMIQDALGVVCIVGWISSYYFLKTIMYLVQMSNILSFILKPARIPKQISILKGLGPF